MKKTHYERLLNTDIFPMRKIFDGLSKELPEDFDWEMFCKSDFVKESVASAPQVVFHLYSYYSGSGRTYEVTDGIAEMLLNTKLNIDRSIVQSPFKEIIIKVPSGLLNVHNHDTGPHDLECIYVNFNEEPDGTKAIKCMAVGRSNNDDPYDDAIFYFRVDLEPGLVIDSMKKSIAEWRQEPNFNEITSEKDVEVFPRFFQFTLNVLLYLTSHDCDIRKFQSEYPGLEAKLKGLKNPAKIRKLQKRMDKITKYPYYVIGSNIQISKEEQMLYSAIKGSGKHSVRYPVGGHWRMQPFGPKLANRRAMWIKPHFRGPELAELIKSIGVMK